MQRAGSRGRRCQRGFLPFFLVSLLEILMTIVKKVAVLVYGLYLCVVVTIDDGIDMFKVLYFNGSFVRAEEESSKDVEQVGNAIIMASNEGWPFRGKPEDFARDALGRINDQLGFEIGLFPVILSSNGSMDKSGDYTTEVVFQAVF